MLDGGGGGLSHAEDQQQQDRKRRLARACTAKTSARLAPLAPTVERPTPRKSNSEDRDFFTVLTTPPPPPHRRRWLLRNMWELASVLNFFHVFRSVININVEFTAEELETSLITPNNLLDDIHIPLLKAIPPIIRSALGRGTWVTVLCKKLKDWWFWVAEGELPIIASHGEEIGAYKELDPGTRVLILKALCEIRVQQEDIQRYIDDSLKHGFILSTFRKERIGGDVHGTSFWYEDDPILGHRLYREIRKIEVKTKAKGKGRSSLPIVTCQWETVAVNFDELQVVAEKLFSSRNRMEAGIGKKLKNDILPELETVQKRKERALKKQQRQALLLDNFVSSRGPSSGRSLRDRKPVTYTFDDFDRSINEAIKVTTKKQPSPEPILRRFQMRSEIPTTNGRVNGKLNSNLEYSDMASSSDPGNEIGESDSDDSHAPLTRSDRQRRRPQRYSEKEFVEAVSDNEADFDSDEEIVGEAVYDDEYIRSRRRKKQYSSSEGDDEYKGDEDSIEEEEDDGDALSTSEDVDDGQNLRWRQRLSNLKKRKERKLKSFDELQSGLRRSKRATRTINYSQYDISNSDEEYAEASEKPAGSSQEIDELKRHSYVSSSADYDMESEESHDMTKYPKDEKLLRKCINKVDASLEKGSVQETTCSTKEVTREQPADVKKRRFIDLNELAPVAGLDDGPAV
ncbi:hypothetical protein SUGI_0661180 [Cryptomeria japonica]|nr:hypothetical protein SUGI_0661180 [Cryptomeria japonica]